MRPSRIPFGQAKAFQVPDVESPSADEMMPCTSWETESFGPVPGAAVLPSLALALAWTR